MFILAGALLLAGTVAYNISYKSTELGVNSENAIARAKANEINNASIETAMRMLADNPTMRTPYSKTMQGGTTTVTFRDTVIAGEAVIVALGKTSYLVGLDTGRAEATVAVSLKPSGFVPLTVRGAITAFGPIDDLIGDMYIDGREHDLHNVVVPNKGIFAVSTGASSFTNRIGAYLGGSYSQGESKRDHPPALTVDMNIIETSSSWPHGWPTTPDAAVNLTEGTLKSIALSGVDGSQYITSNASWRTIRIQGRDENYKFAPRMNGVTFIDVPPGTEWDNIALSKGSEGLMVFHSSSGDALWYRIAMENDDRSESFKGLMIFDRIFHVHINVLGAMIALNPRTESGDCPSNKDHWVNYSSETIKNATKIKGATPQGRWRNILAVRSWKEQAETNERGRGRGRGNDRGNGNNNGNGNSNGNH
jgi:hypothetical protein